MTNFLFPSTLSARELAHSFNVGEEINMLHSGKSLDPFKNAPVLAKLCTFLDQILSGFGFEPTVCDAYADYHASEAQKALVSLHLQIATIDLNNIAPNNNPTQTLELDFQGEKIRFNEIMILGFIPAIKITVGGKTKLVENCTLKNLQKKIASNMEQYSDTYIQSEETVSGGNISEVTKITYINGDVYFFKPCKSSNTGYANLYSGIPQKNGRYAERSILCYEINKVLGFDVVPETLLATNSQGVKGYIQKMVPGITAGEYLKVLCRWDELDSITSDGDIVRQAVELQLVGALVGQGDHHWGNYFIDPETKKLMGIDWDTSFGFLNIHPNYMIEFLKDDDNDHFIAGISAEGEENIALIAAEKAEKAKKAEEEKNKGAITVNKAEHQHAASEPVKQSLPRIFSEHEKKAVEYMREQILQKHSKQWDRKLTMAGIEETKRPKEIETRANNKIAKAFTSGRAVFLPPVMDDKMVAQFNGLSKEFLSQLMQQRGFTEAEISAACLRLEAIHFHIQVLTKRNEAGVHSIIKPDEWGSSKTQERLFHSKNNAARRMITSTTYLHRDMFRAETEVTHECQVRYDS